MNPNPDRRSDPRIDTDEPVTVTILTPPEPPIPAKLTNLSGRGACLELDRDIPPGTPIRIDLPDTLLLGDVIYSRRAADGFQLGVELEHALHHTTDLARLNRLLLGDAVTPERVQ